MRTAVKSSLPGARADSEVLTSTLIAEILHDVDDDDVEPVVSEEKKAIFYAAAELAVRYFFEAAS